MYDFGSNRKRIMRLPISLALFLRYGDLLAENCVFSYPSYSAFPLPIFPLEFHGEVKRQETTPCPRKKTSHFHFCHNFAICGDIFFTIFETFCSGIIHA